LAGVFPNLSLDDSAKIVLDWREAPTMKLEAWNAWSKRAATENNGGVS
jgi:hypothetical protein